MKKPKPGAIVVIEVRRYRLKESMGPGAGWTANYESDPPSAIERFHLSSWIVERNLVAE